MQPHLRDDGHRGAELLEAHFGDVNTIDDNGAAAQLLQPEQAVDERALARAGAADNSTPRSGRNLHGQALEHQRKAVPVAHLHAVELHLQTSMSVTRGQSIALKHRQQESSAGTHEIHLLSWT